MGWPEVFGGYELDNPGLLTLSGTRPVTLFDRESRPGPARTPLLRFPPHSSSDGVAFSTSDEFDERVRS